MSCKVSIMMKNLYHKFLLKARLLLNPWTFTKNANIRLLPVRYYILYLTFLFDCFCFSKSQRIANPIRKTMMISVHQQMMKEKKNLKGKRRRKRWGRQNFISWRLMQFSIVSKIIRDCIGYALLRSVIGPKYPSHSPNQSNAKLTNHESVARLFPTLRGIFLSSD